MTDGGIRMNGVDRGRWLVMRLRALRAFSFPASVLPVVVATAAVRPVSQWDWPVLAVAAFGVMLLHAAGNLFNDYFDFRSGVDRKLADDTGRPGRQLIRGELRPRDVFIEAAFCFVLALAAAAWLLWRCGPGVAWFCGAAALGLYAYTGPPFHLKYRALGEPLIFVVFGPLLMLGAAYTQTGRLELTAGLLSIPIGLLTTAILVGNNVRDHDEDRAAGVVTLTQVAGVRAVRVLYALLVVLGAVMLAAFGIAGLAPRVLIAAPLLLALIMKPLIRVLRGHRLPDVDAQTARYETALLVFVAVALIWK